MIFHLPASEVSLTRENALSMSVDTTAGTSNAGILSPIVNTVLSLKGLEKLRAQCGARVPIDPMINIRYNDRMNRSDLSPASAAAGALPSLRQLRYLVVLAEKLNFRAAAEACFVTQSTLSAGIKELESQLDAHLVERDKKSVRLTPLGEQMVERARRLMAEAGDLVAAARAGREPLSGPFRLGVIPTIAPFLLPAALPPLRERFPRLKLFLREDLTARLLEQLRAGQLDAALIALPFDTGELEVRELLRDEFWFVARADDPLAKRKAVAIERLDVNDVILLE